MLYVMVIAISKSKDQLEASVETELKVNKTFIIFGIRIFRPSET